MVPLSAAFWKRTHRVTVNASLALKSTGYLNHALALVFMNLRSQLSSRAIIE